MHIESICKKIDYGRAMNKNLIGLSVQYYLYYNLDIAFEILMHNLNK